MRRSWKDILLFSGASLMMVLTVLWQTPGSLSDGATVAQHQGAQDEGNNTQAATEPRSGVADTPAKDAPMSVWMEKKLQYSQEILRLLAVGDLEELAITGNRLRLVGKVEGFARSADPTYSSHLKTFELANRELIRQADRGSVEGATLAFHQMTSSCVACHAVLRQQAKTVTD